MNNAVSNNIDAIHAIFQKHGVSKAYVFGSALRDSFNSKSDIDFLVQFSNTQDPVDYGSHFMETWIELSQLLQRDIDLVAEETLTNPVLIDSIKSTRQLIYG